MPIDDAIKNSLRVLVIEDNPDDYLLLLDFLQECDINAETHCVDNEADLLHALERSWDIVLSDYSLPSIQGERILEVVRSKDPIVSFVFLSGTIGEAAIVEVIKAGAQDYIMKNDLSRLLPTLQREQREMVVRQEAAKQQLLLKKLSMAINQTADSIVILDRDGTVEYVNPAFERMTGYSAEEAIGQHTNLFYSEAEQKKNQLQRDTVLSSAEPFNSTVLYSRKDQSQFYADKSISPIKDDTGQTTHLVKTIRDITIRIEAESEKNRLAHVLENTPDCVLIIDHQRRLTFVNQSAQQLLAGEEQPNLLGMPLDDILPADFQRLFEDTILPALATHGIWRDEQWIQPKIEGSKPRPISWIAATHIDPSSKEQFIALIGRDISERKQFESELLFQATHDTLTQLPNRLYIRELLSTAIANARRQETKLAVIMLDLDNFKVINHSLGHSVGDKLLKEIKRRLSSCLRNTDIIARLGSDEFAVIGGDIQEPEHVSAMLSKIDSVLKLPVRLDETEFFVTLSSGIAIFPQDGDSVDELLRKANIAMKSAQAKGKGQYQFYSPEIDAKGREYLELESDLRYAIINEELCLFYQPQVEIESGIIVGVEALLRWASPKRGLVSPAEFIPILESTGLIIRVGEWIIAQACQQHHRFVEAGLAEVRISVNVSAVQFQDQEFHNKVEAILGATQIPPHLLELEITENMLMQDPDGASRTLLTLANMGVRTAIDDFGTGYSSLSYLKTFPLSTLKIDQSFVRDIETDQGAAVIVEASVDLAHRLNMEVVAEGVETEQQLAFIRDTDCRLVQGYLFSKPLPEDKILEFMSGQQRQQRTPGAFTNN